jgi:hypothetical protein
MRRFGYFGVRGGLFAALVAMSAPAAAAPVSFTDLGFIGDPGEFTFDTFGSLNVTNGGSSADTELGLWDEAGTLLAQNDDTASTLLSEIVITLPAGVYFIGINEFDSIFGDDFANTGTGAEDGEELSIVLNIDGAEAATATLIGQAGVSTTEETLFFRAEVEASAAVVPLPATLPLLLAGLAVIGVLRGRQTG